jgi:hypothetical protein
MKDITNKVVALLDTVMATGEPPEVMVAAAAVIIDRGLKQEAAGTVSLVNDCLRDSALPWRLTELRQ